MTETTQLEQPVVAVNGDGQKRNRYERNIKITDEFMQKYSFQRNGQDVVLVKGLMHLAHELGFQSVQTRFVQFPSQENGMTAFAETKVIDEFGRVWIESGDANPQNVGKMVAPHFPRMALTRSKGRALRDALGLQLLVDEELEVMIETAQDSYARKPTPEDFARFRELRLAKGKDRNWVIDMADKLFGKAPGDLSQQELNILIVLLEELPDAAPQEAEATAD